MLRGLLSFLIGCLILAVVLYVAHLMLGMMSLPGNVEHLATIIIGLLGLVALGLMVARVFRGGGPPFEL